MATQTLTVERSYSVTFSENRNGLNVALSVLTLPMTSYPELRLLLEQPTRQGITAVILQTLLGLDAVTFHNPRASHLTALIAGLVCQVADTEGLPPGTSRDADDPVVRSFVSRVVEEPFVPIEESPLSGTSLSHLAREGSLLAFATVNELYGLQHHDPFVVVGTPVCVVVIGAVVGAGEGLRERIREYVAGLSGGHGTPRGKVSKPSRPKKLE
jgi:hypothetical protein